MVDGIGTWEMLIGMVRLTPGQSDGHSLLVVDVDSVLVECAGAMGNMQFSSSS